MPWMINNILYSQIKISLCKDIFNTPCHVNQIKHSWNYFLWCRKMYAWLKINIYFVHSWIFLGWVWDGGHQSDWVGRLPRGHSGAVSGSAGLRVKGLPQPLQVEGRHQVSSFCLSHVLQVPSEMLRIFSPGSVIILPPVHGVWVDCGSYRKVELMFVYVCWMKCTVLKYIHMHVHSHMHARTHAHTHAHTHTRTHAHTHTRTHACTHTRTHTHTHTHKAPGQHRLATPLWQIKCTASKKRLSKQPQ